jgi:predicted TIM-barrel fold metal-dependent hydrolase
MGRITPQRVARAVRNRLERARNEVLVRRQPLHSFSPRPALVSAETPVRSAQVPAVDAHNHLGRWLNGGEKWMVHDVGWLVATMDELNVATMVNLDGRWDAELEANIARYDAAHPGRFVTFCQLDWSLLTDSRFPKLLSESLRRAVEGGAGGIKVWKDLGLSARDEHGKLVLPDDERLHDVWETAGELDLPVLIHTADPVAFWQPVDRMNERFEELTLHPDWQHGSRPVPSYERLMGSFERLVAAHPRTTFIGAHVAGCAEDLNRASAMLDRYPNLVVDLAAREAELGRQPRAAHAFLTRHADRVLWGTDSFGVRPDQYRSWFRILETTDEYFPYSAGPPEQGRWAVYGIGLDEATLRPIYTDTARRVIPALRTRVPS